MSDSCVPDLGAGAGATGNHGHRSSCRTQEGREPHGGSQAQSQCVAFPHARMPLPFDLDAKFDFTRIPGSSGTQVLRAGRRQDCGQVKTHTQDQLSLSHPGLLDRSMLDGWSTGPCSVLCWKAFTWRLGQGETELQKAQENRRRPCVTCGVPCCEAAKSSSPCKPVTALGRPARALSSHS